MRTAGHGERQAKKYLDLIVVRVGGQTLVAQYADRIVAGAGRQAGQRQADIGKRAVRPQDAQAFEDDPRRLGMAGPASHVADFGQ